MEKAKTFVDRKKLNLAVKQEFQRWLLKQVLIAVAVSAVLAALILYFYARQEVLNSFFDAHVKIRRVSDLLLPVVCAGSAVSLLVGVFLSLFLPQKIAGPIYRIEKGLKEIAAGDLTTVITLRDNDTLKDFAESVNQTTAALRSQIHQAKIGCMALDKAVMEGDVEKVAELMQRQKEHIAKLIT